MARLLIALAAFAAVAPVAARPAFAAERRASVQGVEDRALRQAIEQAIGEVRDPPESRLAARSNAQAAAVSADALLRSEGYYQAQITPGIGEGDRPQAFVTIDPGTRFHFKPTDVEWLATAPDADSQAAARDAGAVPDGGPGRAVEVLAAEGRVIALLQLKGYADAASAPRNVVVDHADFSVHPTLRFNSGPLVLLGRIELDNKGRTDPRWIEKLRPWKPGDVYRPVSIAELETRLLDTKVYDAVTVALKPEADPDGTRPVVVALADRRRRTLEFGAGYSTSEGYDIDTRWSYFNKLRRGDTLTAELKYGGINSRLGVDLSLPHWSRPGTTLKATAELFQNLTDAYDETGAAIRADLTRRRSVTSYAYFTRGLSLTRSEITDKHIGDVDVISLAALGAIAIDRSDSPLDPRRGWRFEARAEPTAITGDETLAFLKVQSQASAYLPLSPNAGTVVAGRVKLGAIMGGKIPELPAGSRFFSGGGGSVRGFSYQGVGPRYSDGVPIGGLSLFEAALEVRQRLPKNFGAVVFVDTGSVGQAINPDFNNLKFAYGVGFRYDLGFAPFRLDVAFPIDRPPGDSRFQIYLSIGQSF